MTNNYYGWREVTRVLLQKRKALLLVFIAGLLVFSAIAFLLPQYYKSSAIFYSYNIQVFSPRTETVNEPLDIFSGMEESDRLITLASSSGIENMIIRKFNLAAHYDIDTTRKGFRGELVEEFRSNYKVIKNERGAIEVIVYDKDPEIASSIANEIVFLADLLNKQPLLKANRQLSEIYRTQYLKRSAETDTVKSTGNASRFNSSYDIMQLQLQEGKMQELNAVDWKSLYIVNRAVPSEKAVSPRRWLIITGGTLLVLFLTAVCFAGMEFIRQEKLSGKL